MDNASYLTLLEANFVVDIVVAFVVVINLWCAKQFLFQTQLRSNYR